MSDFFNLVQNENMKIYNRARTYVMLGFVVGLVLVISIMWLIFGGRDVSMWDVVFLETSILFLLVTIFTVVIAASAVAEEFSTGTIKLLLIRPWSRSKILLSKYISILMFSLVLTVILLISTIAVNWVCFHISAAETYAVTFPIPEGTSVFVFLLQYYALTYVSMIVTVTLSFMLSTIFRSSGLAIGMALFLLLVVNNIIQLLYSLDYKWIEYILFLHLDLTQYLYDFQPREGMTLGFSLGVLAGYYVIFIALTWYVFNKRDVAP